MSRTTHRFLVAVAPLYITAAAFLLLARMVLLHRAFAPPSHGGRRLFARLDALFERVNSKLGGAAYRQSRQHALPDVQPILWRETSRGILGRPQHLVRLGLGVLLVVCAVLTLLLLINPFSRFAGSLSFMGEALAVVGVLAVAACACDSLGRERTQQTLEVLLTTPIPPRDIIKEKLASAQRLSWIFIPNIALIAAVKFAILEISAAQTGGSDLTAFGSAYPWFLAACFLIGLPLMFGVIRWYAVWISIRIRNRSRALLVCLGVLALWVGTPIVLSIFAPANKQTQRWATAISPFGILAHADQGTFFKLSTYRPQDRSAQQTATIQRALIVFAIHGGMLLAFRTLSLRATRKYLRQ